jgi:AcrR family transcriptional regulator
MPKITRSFKEVDAVRERILDCALKILVENGYESLSMAKLGSKMNMTAANIYNYYTNKDELLIAIHKKTYAMLYNKIRNAVKITDAPLQRFQNIVNAFVEFGTNNINIYDVMFNRLIKQYSDYIGTPLEELSSNEFNNSRKTLTFAVKIIRGYIETRPNLNPDDAEFLTIQIISALHGIISLYNSRSLHQVVDDPEIVLKNIVNNIIHSLLDETPVELADFHEGVCNKSRRLVHGK